MMHSKICVLQYTVVGEVWLYLHF